MSEIQKDTIKEEDEVFQSEEDSGISSPRQMQNVTRVGLTDIRLAVLD